MTEHLFYEEVDMVLDGLVNAPIRLVNYLRTHKEATLEELQNEFGYKSKRFVDGWISRMQTNLAVVAFVDLKDMDTQVYQLSPFARDMLSHIANFRNEPSSERKET